MKALQIQQFGGFHVVDLLDPKATEGTAIIRVVAASINPSDVKNVEGRMKQTTLPRVPGRDYAGVVESGPENWIGKEVWGSGGDTGFTRDGTHAQKIAVPVESLREKPSKLSFEEAACVGVNFIAAWCSIVQAARLEAGETLAIIGSSGGVGGAAAQIAKLIGARIIGIDRQEPLPDAPILAIADVLISNSSDAGASIREATGGSGAQVVFDTVGGVAFRSALSALSIGGRLVEISATGTREVCFDLADFYHNESRLFGVDTLKRDLVASASILESLRGGFESGAYRPAPISAAYGLDDAQEAYKLVEAGAKGRIVLKP